MLTASHGESTHFNPEARIIYLVRDPVVRTIRHYWQRAKELFETLPMEKAIVEGSIYVDTSDYKLQVDQYLKYFDRSATLVVASEDLRHDRRASARFDLRLARPADYRIRRGRTYGAPCFPTTSRRARFALAKSIRDSPAWAAIRPLMPKAAKDLLARAGTATFERSSVDDTAVREGLVDYFRPRVAEFETLCGRKFPSWLETKQQKGRPGRSSQQTENRGWACALNIVSRASLVDEKARPIAIEDLSI